MKDEILNVLTMKDILDKYGIKQKRDMFSCPFHGADKNPSAKYYQNSYYCFNCGKTGDLIQFVQYYFNLSFKEAMQKINIDFNLGLNLNTKIDKEKIRKIEQERLYKAQQKQNLLVEYLDLSERYRILEKTILLFKQDINILNWQDFEFTISELNKEQELINIRLEEIDNLL